MKARHPDYHRPYANHDWWSLTRRELPRDDEMPYTPSRCDCARCEARRPLERVLTWCAWGGWGLVIALIFWP